MKKTMITFGIVLSALAHEAQNEIDALRYSFMQRPASARSYGMGTAFGAIGADISSFFGNPAGVGYYKRGGMELSFSLVNNDNTALYTSQSTNDGGARLSINNFGIIGSRKPKNTDWVNFNFGIGYARTNQFYDNITIRGAEFNTTLMDVFAAQAAGIAPEDISAQLPFTAGLAYEVYAIDPADSLGSFYIPAASGGQVVQVKDITRRGFQQETSFTFGANFRDRLAIGGALFFQGVNFSEVGRYTESFEDGEPLDRLAFNETLNTNGTGVGLRLGVIGRPTDWLRVGAGFQTGTVISMKDTYTSDMNTNMANGDFHSWTSPLLITNYNLRTPSRLMANAAFVLGKVGVISADYEFANFEGMKMRGTGANSSYNYATENNTIQQIYRGTHRVAAGMEWRIDKSYYVRGGAIYQQSPFISGVAINTPWITYTGGLGYHGDYFFADLAGSYSERDNTYYIYQTVETEAATITRKQITAMLSVGFRY